MQFSSRRSPPTWISVIQALILLFVAATSWSALVSPAGRTPSGPHHPRMGQLTMDYRRMGYCGDRDHLIGIVVKIGAAQLRRPPLSRA